MWIVGFRTGLQRIDSNAGMERSRGHAPGEAGGRSLAGSGPGTRGRSRCGDGDWSAAWASLVLVGALVDN